MTFQSNFGNCSSLKLALLKQVKPLPFKHIVGDNQEELLSFVIFWRNIIINLFRITKKLKDPKSFHSILQPAILNINLIYVKIRLTRYLKDHVIHTPVPKQSLYNWVIVLHLISVSYNCLLAGALPTGPMLFGVCPGTGCLDRNLTAAPTQCFLTPSPTLPMMLHCLSALMKTNSVTFKVLPGF